MSRLVARCLIASALLVALAPVAVAEPAGRGLSPAEVIDAALLETPATERLERSPGAWLIGGEEAKSPWSFSMGLALSLAQGNSDSFDLTADASATYEKDPWKWKVKTTFAYGEKDGSTSTEALHVTLHAERKLSERVYVFGNLDFDRDEPAGLEYRWTPVGGLGFVLVKGRTIEVKGELGGGYTWEKRIGQSSTGNPAAYFGLEYAKTWDSGTKLTAEYKFIPNLGDFDLSVMTWELKLAQPVCAEIDLTISLRVDYVFEPPAPSESTDVLFGLGLRANF